MSSDGISCNFILAKYVEKKNRIIKYINLKSVFESITSSESLFKIDIFNAYPVFISSYNPNTSIDWMNWKWERTQNWKKQKTRNETNKYFKKKLQKSNNKQPVKHLQSESLNEREREKKIKLNDKHQSIS